MRINFEGGGHMTISDSDPKAIKIKQGYSFKCKNGELAVTDKKTNFDWDAFEKNSAIDPILKQAILELKKEYYA